MSQTLDALGGHSDGAEPCDIGQEFLHWHEYWLKNRGLSIQGPFLERIGRFSNTGHLPQSDSWSDVVNMLTHRAWDMISETTSQPGYVHVYKLSNEILTRDTPRVNGPFQYENRRNTSCAAASPTPLHPHQTESIAY